MIASILAALAVLQSPAATNQQPLPQEPGSVRIFGDWAVGCDNGWHCEAISLPSEDWSIGNGYSITARQAGGPEGSHRIGIRVFEEYDGDSIALHIDGDHVGTARRSDDYMVFEFDPENAARIAGRIARGGEARLRDTDGGDIDQISLAGSYAALLFIEDRQGRNGTVRASAAVGDEPASSIPAPPSPPLVRAMPVAARHGASAEPLPLAEAEALHEARECDGFGVRRTRNDSFVLSDAADLILISCSDGAYNFSDIAFVRRNGEVTPARFDRAFAWGENSEIPLLVNAFWNAEANELSTYAKGRGIGDCGTAERFVWDGAMFRLVERREMNSCRGSPHWITVWRADVEWVEP